MATLRYKGGSLVNENNTSSNIPDNGVGCETKNVQQDQQMHIMYDMSIAKYSQREIMTNSYQINEVPSEAVKPRKVKQTEENKELPKKPVKLRRVGRKGAENLKKEGSTSASNVCKVEQDLGADENQDRQISGWKDNLELNQVNFDDSAMPIPVCSCTGVPQPCYKWGNGGFDLSSPLDLKDHWAKHGTNRYSTVK
ncbi:hypothetical protein POM88_008928 [Heracleum sosnowskyi]|uniref:GAGA-binding transcriptional activator n=1 Tax=Heracleum sosnowskyi TaxID=360622 RepID=A0AAD8J754_9APIA|nr:hypothetical protein POM88_008928 [Heracleum sosnowskyi]